MTVSIWPPPTSGLLQRTLYEGPGRPLILSGSGEVFNTKSSLFHLLGNQSLQWIRGKLQLYFSNLDNAIYYYGVLQWAQWRILDRPDPVKWHQLETLQPSVFTMATERGNQLGGWFTSIFWRKLCLHQPAATQGSRLYYQKTVHLWEAGYCRLVSTDKGTQQLPVSNTAWSV